MYEYDILAKTQERGMKGRVGRVGFTDTTTLGSSGYN